MTTRARAGALLVALVAAAPWFRGTAADDAPAKPLDLDIVEQTERRMVQLDVSVRLKDARQQRELPELAPGDLELVIAGRRTPITFVDRLCAPTARAAAPAAPAPAAPAAAAPDAPVPSEPTAATPAPGVFLFYFEHENLTMQGQEIALKMAEHLIPQVIVGGRRGMVVSSGDRLFQTELTDDPQVLLDALREIRADKHQWRLTQYAEDEVTRYKEILSAPSDSISKSLARMYQIEEIRLTTRRLHLFEATLGSLAALDPPKVALYFADTIRREPGRHYSELFGSGDIDREITRMETSSFTASAAFDRVTKVAGGLGVRLYTFQAQGLISTGMTEALYSTGGQRIPTRRHEQAEETMSSLALETGGATFRGGLDSGTLGKVLDRIERDMQCVWVLNFPADQLGEDQPLPVRVRFNQDSPRFAELDGDFELTSRGQIVVQSAGKRKEAVLLAAHAAQSALDADRARGAVVPLSFDEGEFRGLVQMVVTNPAFARELSGGLTWEVGLTQIHDHDVGRQTSARIDVTNPEAPVVLETEWSFKPGKSKIVGVAYESRLGQIATMNLEVDWPEPSQESVSIGPLAMVQPMSGVFVRVGADDRREVRKEGSVVVGLGAALVDRPTWMVGIVCRSRRARQELWVERRLTGASSVEFPLQKWEWSSESLCVQLRDLIPAGVMDWGSFKFEAWVHASPDKSGTPLAVRSVEFAALAPGTSAGPASGLQPEVAPGVP